MIKTFGLASIVCLLLLPTQRTNAQTRLDKALQTFSVAIGNVGLGKPEHEFLLVKTQLKRPEAPLMDFREEITETIQKNGLTEITYYFDTDGERLLYEMILEFEDDSLCQAVAASLFGKPNHPKSPNYWIAGASDNVVTLAWTYGPRLIIASNIPGTEWDGDATFQLPPGFQFAQQLPHMSSWPDEEKVRFTASLERQIAAANSGFEAYRGTPTSEGYGCNQPLSGAETAGLVQGKDQKWILRNQFISGASGDNAMLWKLDAEAELGKLETISIRLVRTKSEAGLGGRIQLFDVRDKKGNTIAGQQVGLMVYEQPTKGLWNVDILVLQR